MAQDFDWGAERGRKINAVTLLARSNGQARPNATSSLVLAGSHAFPPIGDAMARI